MSLNLNIQLAIDFIMVKIFGLSKFEYHSDYILEKKQEFLSGFRKFLVDIGFGEESSNFEIYSFARPLDKDGEPDASKEISISKLVDQHYFFQNNDYMIDLVIGKQKIFLMISTTKDRQEEISVKVQKFCSF